MRLAWFTPLPTNATLKSALTTVAVLDGVRRSKGAEGAGDISIELFTTGDEIRRFEADAAGSGCRTASGSPALQLGSSWAALEKPVVESGAVGRLRRSELELVIGDSTLRGADGSFSVSDTRGSVDRFPVFHFLRAFERNQTAPFDLFVYQLEDDPRLEFVTSQLGVRPGVIYLHDLNLNRLVLSRFEHSTGGTDLRAEAESRFGSAAPPFGAWHVRGWSFEAFDRSFIRGNESWDGGAVVLVPDSGFASVIKNTNRSSGVPPESVITQSVHLEGPQAAVSVLPPPLPRRLIGENRLEAIKPLVLFAGTANDRDRARKVIQGLLLSREQGSSATLCWLLESENEIPAATRLLDRCGVAAVEGAGESSPPVSLRVMASRRERELLLRSATLVLSPGFDPYRSPAAIAREAVAFGVPLALSAGPHGDAFPQGSYVELPIGAGEIQAIATAIRLAGGCRSHTSSSIPDSRSHAHSSLSGEEFLRSVIDVIEKERARHAARTAAAESAHRAAGERLLRNVRDRERALSFWPEMQSIQGPSAFTDFGWNFEPGLIQDNISGTERSTW